ncbi:hypothetical protein BDW62DRAFT_63762 [Aspergillus aurantiobrunneus]
MVYPGRPSTGCQTCRSRRIKCDETRPHCSACVRSGRECPGYPHPLDVVLRPQRAFNRRSGNGNTTVVVQSANSRNNVDTKSESSSHDISPMPCYPATSGSVTPPQVPGGLYLPMEDTVTAFFFNSYLYTPRDPLIRPGSMELLPRFYAAAPFDSHLRMGSLAVAFFCVAAWTHQESLLQTAQQCFGKALFRTRRALQGNFEQTYDEILMTLVLLYIYEEFVSIKENKPSPKHHLQGAIALINSCGPERQTSDLTDTLTNAIQGEIVFSAIDGTSPLFRKPEVWPLSPGIPELASSRLMTISTTLVELRVRWEDFAARADNTSPDEIEAIFSEARSIDDQFVAWTHSLPKHWDPAPATFFPQSVRDAGAYQDRCDCYTDLWVAETWNNYRTFRLRVQNIILRCLSLLPSRTEDIESTTATIHTLATDICASVPFYLGSQTGSMHITDSRVEYPSAETKCSPQRAAPLVGGWFIRPSLDVLCTTENLPEDLVGWARGQVQRVQQIYTSGLTHRL